MSDEQLEHPGERPPSRRRALKIGAGVAAVAWATPTILSLPASAQASGQLTAGENIIADPGFDLPF